MNGPRVECARRQASVGIRSGDGRSGRSVAERRATGPMASAQLHRPSRAAASASVGTGNGASVTGGQSGWTERCHAIGAMNLAGIGLRRIGRQHHRRARYLPASASIAMCTDGDRRDRPWRRARIRRQRELAEQHGQDCAIGAKRSGPIGFSWNLMLRRSPPGRLDRRQSERRFNSANAPRRSRSASRIRSPLEESLQGVADAFDRVR